MDHLKPPYDGILVELRDIVFLSSSEDIKIPVNTFRSILYCGATAEYQSGRLTRTEYHARLAVDFDIPEDEIRDAISTVQQTTTVQRPVLQRLQSIKDAWHGRVKVFTMTNMSHEEYEHARQLLPDWSVFDEVFLSADMGMRKPEQRAFLYVMERIGAALDRLVLVDAETDNVLVAMSLGIKGVLCDDTSIGQALLNLFSDSI